jgi:hypothetical protein
MQYMLQAWVRICSTLGNEFLPCMPFVSRNWSPLLLSASPDRRLTGDAGCV